MTTYPAAHTTISLHRRSLRALVLVVLLQACGSSQPPPGSDDLRVAAIDLAVAVDLAAPPPEENYTRCVQPCPFCVFAPTPDAPVGAACMPACAGGCPAPSSGDAQPVCQQQLGFCALSCVTGQCPAGMKCLATMAPGLKKVCVWPVGG